MADTLIYLKLTNVSGESSAQDFSKHIELESFDWDMRVEPARDGSKRQAEPLRLGHAKLRKFYDFSSGGILRRAQLQSRGDKKPAFAVAEVSYVDVVIGAAAGSGKTTVLLAKFKLNDCYVESVNLGVASGGKSMRVDETVTLSFRSINVSYFPPTDDRVQRAGGMHFHIAGQDNAG